MTDERIVHIHGLIQDWLSFVNDPKPATEENLSRLDHVLDLLALSRHSLEDVGRIIAEDGQDPPGWSDQATLRKSIATRFPMLGFYNIPADVTSNFSNATLHLGDAIDDLLDITNELLQVKWLIENNLPGDASWNFAFTYDHHWRYHLRSLQWYLEMRRFEST